MAYTPQYGPGQSVVAENRRKQMNPNVKLEKIRNVTDEDIVLILGHRAPGQAYPTAHPPLAEQGEPDCPIRKIVTPTDGAKAGDRVRYIQFADSVYNAPSQPYQRTYTECYRYRGIDPGPAVRSSNAVSVTLKRSPLTSSTRISSTRQPLVSVVQPCTVTHSVLQKMV